MYHFPTPSKADPGFLARSLYTLERLCLKKEYKMKFKNEYLFSIKMITTNKNINITKLKK